MEVFNIAPAFEVSTEGLRIRGEALLYLTDRSKAVYVQTTDGYSVMLSPSEPGKFLAALDMLVGQ